MPLFTVFSVTANVKLIQSLKHAILPPRPKEKSFQCLESTRSSRTIAAWSGVLPRSPYARHHLEIVGITEQDCKLEFLRTGLRPFRAFPSATTEVWVGYRYLAVPEKFRLVFRSQFDFRVPGRSTRQVALEVGNYLALVLQNQTKHYQLFEYNEGLELDCEAIYRNILFAALEAKHISRAAFELEPEFYKSSLSRC